MAFMFDDGTFYLTKDDFSNKRTLYKPTGVKSLRDVGGLTTCARRYSGYAYNSRYYMVGGHSDNLVVDEHYRVLRQGMVPPTITPSVSVGAGATDQLCYLSYWDELTQERSPLSGAKSVTGNTTRAWTNLPTTVPGEMIRYLKTVTCLSGVITTPAFADGVVRPGDRVSLSNAPTRIARVRSVNPGVSVTLDDTNAALNGAGQTVIIYPKSRPTHLELWVAVAGTLPRLATRVRMGTTSITEATPTLSLGEAFIDNFERFPVCSMNAFYQDRQLMAGDERNRDTLYLSELFFPERWAGLSFKTRNGDPITAIVGQRDYALVFTLESCYMLKGYTETDLVFRLIDLEVGSMGHLATKVIQGIPITANRRGWYAFTGSFQHIMPGRRTEWQRLYDFYTTGFSQGFTVHNPNDFTFQFNPNGRLMLEQLSLVGSDPRPVVEHWIGDYGPRDSFGRPSVLSPRWCNDQFSSFNHAGGYADCSAAAYLRPTDREIGMMVYAVIEDGVNNEYVIFRESFYSDNVDSAGGVALGLTMPEEDDFAPFPGKFVFRTKFYNFGQPGGDKQDGKTLKKFWWYVVAETSLLFAQFYAGDEYCREGLYPLGGTATFSWRKQLGATALSDTDIHFEYPEDQVGATATFVRWAPVSVHPMVPERVTGRGFVFELTKDNFFDIRVIGFGGIFGPGKATRDLVIFTEDPG